jgi:PTH1 family peptidyl-tRNA hydrolase
MLLVAGLGNPGEEYAATPHNIGFLVVDRLAARHGIRITRKECQALIGQGSIGGKMVLLAKPQTYMNLSGVAIKPKGSAAGHNGVTDVIAKIGTQAFPRVRLGVHPGHDLSSGKDYLLSRFTRRQTEELDAFVDHAADAAESVIAEGVEKSMARFNRRAQGSTTEEE